MFTRLNLPSPSSLIPKFLTPKNPLAIDIPAVRVHEIDAAKEKPARALKHLLKLNHVNHAILFNHRLFHNHMPHVSRSSTLLPAVFDFDVNFGILDLVLCLPNGSGRDTFGKNL